MRKLKLKKENGYTLIEVLISLVILGIVGIGFLAAIGTTYKANLTSDQLVSAESLARTQLETIKTQPYSAVYTPIIAPGYSDDGFTVDIEIGMNTGKAGIQAITVTIYHRGESVYSLTGYKSNR